VSLEELLEADGWARTEVIRSAQEHKVNNGRGMMEEGRWTRENRTKNAKHRMQKTESKNVKVKRRK
jgi:hypothetical protein